MSSMEAWTSATLCGFAAPAFLRQRSARAKEQAALAAILAEKRPISLAPRAAGTEALSFSQRFMSLSHFLAPEAFARLAEEIGRRVETERNYIPAHKKGGTIAYETLIGTSPLAVSLYHDDGYREFLSQIIGQPLFPTPLNDQSSLSVLFYERPGDHIGWHFDHDFYRGRHFTVLIAIENRGKQDGGVSAARLMIKQGEREIVVPTPPNTLVFFEGAKVLHKVTPIEEGERRIVLSMTYATDARSTVAQGIARRFKDTAFFGLRALWT